jgi:Ca2+-transporting ATPase
MLLLLIATGIVYLLLGEPHEAVALIVAISVIITITLYQERKTENALQALRDLSSPRALVIREGVRKRIAGRDVVRGDLMVLSEGDRVPADGIVLESRNLAVDESLLTGESLPVQKSVAHAEAELGRPGGDDLPFVFSGTLVTQGRGIAQVRATGIRTELGKIGKMLRTLQPADTPLRKQTATLVRNFAIAGLLLCAAVAIIYGYTRSNWLQGTLAGLTLAISMVPEEFPVVLTIFLAMGAWRISRQGVLTRRMPAIEMLGAATVLCVDKTGTLTLNKMSVRHLFIDQQSFLIEDHTSAIPDRFHELVEYSMLSSSRDPFDPMEKAIMEIGRRFLQTTEYLDPDWSLMREYPLSPALPMIARVWNVPRDNRCMIAAKGAPESILRLCRLSSVESQKAQAAAAEMASQGLRVLGVAKAELTGPLPDDPRCLPLKFIGLIGLADPIRPSVPGAVRECRRAGIRVVMITGDYAVTAQNIAAQIGLSDGTCVTTGAELEIMDEDQLRDRVRTCSVFARVVPEQKLRLVNAFKFEGEVVAMTGDGVNDAPALKAADIGVAMGGRGTDVAREAAALVLLDDDFSSIVNAVRMGRRIYDNLKKATAFIFAVHVPIAGMSLIPVLFRWPLVLMPLHILFIEMVMDPACSIAFEAEPEEADVMSCPPRRRGERLFAVKRVTISLFQGLTVLAAVLTLYGVSLAGGHSESDARALAFSALLIGNIALIFTNRSWTRTMWQIVRSPNPALWWVVVGTFAGLGIVLYVPVVRQLFRLSILHLSDVFFVMFVGLSGVLWFEAMKMLRGALKR